jgi:hypothetical protein
MLNNSVGILIIYNVDFYEEIQKNLAISNSGSLIKEIIKRQREKVNLKLHFLLSNKENGLNNGKPHVLSCMV